MYVRGVQDCGENKGKEALKRRGINPRIRKQLIVIVLDKPGIGRVIVQPESMDHLVLQMWFKLIFLTVT